MEEKLNDGIVLMYLKDGVIYPTALSNEQRKMLEMMVASVCNPLHVLFDFPQGSAENLLRKVDKQ